MTPCAECSKKINDSKQEWRGKKFCSRNCKNLHKAGARGQAFARKLHAVPNKQAAGLKKGVQYLMFYQGSYITLQFVENWGAASKFRIIGQNTSQAVYLPQSRISLQGNFLAPQDWFWNRANNKHKLALASIL